MFMFLTGLVDIDERNNDTDNCYNNTHNAYNCFYHHILYLSLYFPYVYLLGNGSSQNVLILVKGEPLTV